MLNSEEEFFKTDAKASSLTGSIYKEYNEEENIRYNNFFYGTMFNDTIRVNVHQELFQIVMTALKKTTVQLSTRVQHIMERIQNTNNIVLQHAFLFFAIATLQEVRDYIFTKYHTKEQKEKVMHYMNTYVKEQTDKLLVGGFKSLSEYTDTNRVNIMLQLGIKY